MKYDLGKLGIDALNPMQQDALQASRRHPQMVLLSPTGSGKTLAYLLPMIEQICLDSDEVQAVVLVPSRELAEQTASVLHRLACGVRGVAVFGGRPAMDEHRTMRGIRPHVIIGTPGRTLDHLQKENFAVSQVQMLVIDEFDKSLELGFQREMEQVLQHLPQVQRRILLSATDCEQIPHFVGTGRDVFRLDYLPEEEQIPDRISLSQVRSPQKDKLETLYRLLCALGESQSLVFVNYRESVDRVANYLRGRDVSVEFFHGGMEQRDRQRALYRFTNGSCRVLVSTDLASRGLDIPGIDHVIHYHLPLNEEAYIHRNGRTARWDAEGCAYMLLGPEEHLPAYIQDDVPLYRIPDRLPSPSRPAWVTLYIGRGKKDKVNRVDIVGFMCQQGGLSREQLGRIDVMDHWAFIAVDRRCVRTLLQTIQGKKIKGQRTIIEEVK